MTVRFGGLVAVDGLDLDLPDTGIFALVGPNGAGKTTLINALSRVCAVTNGSVRLDGVDVLQLLPHQAVSAGIARSFQRAELFPTLTVLENLLVGLHSQMTTGLEGALLTPSTRRQEKAARMRAERAAARAQSVGAARLLARRPPLRAPEAARRRPCADFRAAAAPAG